MRGSMLMLVRREMLCAVVFNSPIIEAYHCYLPANNKYDEPYSTEWNWENKCVTALYEFPAQSFIQTMVTYGLNYDAYGVLRCYKNGVAFDWWGQSTERTCIPIGTNGIRATALIDQLDECYFYLKETGQILFAGKNSIYHGHKNISELN